MSTTRQKHIYRSNELFSFGENVSIERTRQELNFFFPGNTWENTRTFWKITYVISGIGKAEINEEFYDLRPDRIFIVHPQDKTTLHIQGEDMEVYNLLFKDKVLEHFLDEVSEGNGFFELFQQGSGMEKGRMRPSLHLLDASREIRSLIRRMHSEYYMRRPNFDLKLQLMTKELLLELSRLSLRKGSHGENRTSAGKIRDYLADHFREPVDFGKVAKIFYLSRNYLGDFYHSHTGETLGSALGKLRMAEAERLLRETSLPVLQCGLRSGFSDPSNFQKQFKRRYGITPGAWRRKNARAAQ